MADERKFPSEVEFFFEFDKDYRIVASNGAWGGVTSRGDIQIDFFVERQGVPESIKQRVSEQGVIGATIELKPSKRIVRRLQVGVLMTAEQAGSLVKFLNERLKQIEEVKEKIKPEEVKEKI